jgi:uroporphyrinogen-III synthase
LGSYNLKADFIPSKATTANLASEMKDGVNLKDADVIRVRGNLGDDTIESVLAEAGSEVIPLQTYRTIHPTWPEYAKNMLFDYPPDIIIFTSGSTVDGLFENLNQAEIDRLISKTMNVSIGPSTSEKMRARGIQVSLAAKEHNIRGIVNELVEYYSKRK